MNKIEIHTYISNKIKSLKDAKDILVKIDDFDEEALNILKSQKLCSSCPFIISIDIGSSLHQFRRCSLGLWEGNTKTVYVTRKTKDIIDVKDIHPIQRICNCIGNHSDNCNIAEQKSIRPQDCIIKYGAI